MHPRPPQLLLEKAGALFLREASTRRRSNLWQRDDRIEHHQPTHLRIPSGTFGCFPFDTDHREIQRTTLLERQGVPAADVDPPALRRRFTPPLASLPMRLGMCALKQRTIFGWSSARVPAHPNTGALAIAFEPDQDTGTPFMAGPQELRRAIPPIRHDDDPSVPKQRLQGVSLRNGDFHRRLLAPDVLVLPNGGPPAGLLGHQRHGRKRAADPDRMVDQGQLRQMDDRAIRAVSPINGNPDGACSARSASSRLTQMARTCSTVIVHLPALYPPRVTAAQRTATTTIRAASVPGFRAIRPLPG